MTASMVAVALVGASWVALRVHVGAGLRPFPPLVLDGASAAWCWAVALMGTGRPLLSAALVAGGAIGLGTADRAKRVTLGEPLVFADRAELIELLRHPQLYLPFVGTALIIGGSLAIAGIAASLLWLEPPIRLTLIVRSVIVFVLFAVYASLAFPPWLTLLSGRFRSLAYAGDPAEDMRRFGMLATFVVYATIARADRAARQAAHPLGRITPSSPEPARPIVLVQSESFFDVRRLKAAIGGEKALPNYAALTDEAAQSGRLQVPCWGANTIRTEFAVLTGIDAACLGLDAFNPYERFVRVPIDSLAWRLRALGYRTICIHPFDKRFYGRQRALPKLGFDAIIGPEAFGRQPIGSYVPDRAVAAELAVLLDQYSPRVFVFIVTIQGHGPWKSPAHGTELDGYLQTMRSVDDAVPLMREAVGDHGGVLAIYGDHQPSLAQCLTGLEDADTDYVIWDAVGCGGHQLKLRATELAASVYAVAARDHGVPVCVAA